MSVIEEHLKKATELYSDWIKNLAALSIAALTILVSMMPETSPGSPEKYFLAACWVLLAVCIPCSIAASFRPIIESKWLAAAGIDIAQGPGPDGKIPGSNMTIDLHRKNLILLWCQIGAVITFCLSFISLAIYACIRVL
jgi:hypothetical protein